MLEYLKPQNPAAVLVVWALWALFLCWCMILARRAWSCRRAGNSAADITALMPTLAESRRVLELRRASGEAVDPAERFRSELQSAGLDPSQPAARVAGVIFVSGVTESRL